ncbi:MAG TPA: prolyl oligopeptidase family serine peptidase [Kofleriaceae bacterium]
MYRGAIAAGPALAPAVPVRRVLALIAVVACTRDDLDPAVAALTATLTHQNPNPVNLSPSGALVLVKSMHATTFELEIRRRHDGVVIARDRAGDTQLAPTWRFDDGALAFLADRDGDQQHRLFVLDLATGQRRAIANAPPTQAPALRWEPRGTRVAYLVAERGRRERKLVVVDTAATALAPIVALDHLDEHAGFVWSPDGAWVAGVSHASPGTIAIGRSDGNGRRDVVVAQPAEIRSLAWSRDGHVLVTLRREANEHFTLAEVSATTGAVIREVRAGGDISGPLYLPDGGLAFHVNRDGEVSVYTCRGQCDEHRRVGPGDGTAVVTGFSPDGREAWILHTGRVSPPALVGVDLGTGTTATIHAARAEAARDAITGERIDLASHGLRVPAYLWRAKTVADHAPAALVRVRGGPSGQAMRSWDPAIQLLVERGVHVISLNYRGSSGYGAAFENAPVRGNTERVSDVLAARRFAERELGVPPERIILLGHSYGAALVAEAVRRDPRPAGPVALLSYVGPAIAPITDAPRTIVFHGENDVALSPADARRRLASFAPRFVELTHEGHTFRRVGTWARIYTAVLALLD